MVIYNFWFYHELQFVYKSSNILDASKKKRFIELNNFKVKINSKRLICLFKNNICCFCGKQGVFWILESHIEEKPHLNLYSYDPDYQFNDGLILMTRDHIIPSSKGGADNLNNSQTLCELCNTQKADKIYI